MAKIPNILIVKGLFLLYSNIILQARSYVTPDRIPPYDRLYFNYLVIDLVDLLSTIQ